MIVDENFAFDVVVFFQINILLFLPSFRPNGINFCQIVIILWSSLLQYFSWRISKTPPKRKKKLASTQWGMNIKMSEMSKIPCFVLTLNYKIYWIILIQYIFMLSWNFMSENPFKPQIKMYQNYTKLPPLERKGDRHSYKK